MSIVALVMAIVLFVLVVVILLSAIKFAVNEVPRKPKPPLALPQNQSLDTPIRELTEESL